MNYKNFNMNTSFSDDYTQVNMSQLPSKGMGYPENIEIFVTPLTIKERKQLEGASHAEYFRTILRGVRVEGGPFKKDNLLFADVQFLDLVRRIVTFENDRKLVMAEVPCYWCGEQNIKIEFTAEDIEYEDIDPSIFKTVRKFKEVMEDGTEVEDEKTYAGKFYKFEDGLEVLVSPLTIAEFIDLAVRHNSNASEEKQGETNADLYVSQFTYLIKDVVGREFKDVKARRTFVKDYIEGLTSSEDEEVLDKIEIDTTVSAKPFITTCPDCGKEVEVYMNASARFHKIP